MIKNEIKIDFSKTEELEALIQKAYFKEGTQGKICRKINFIKIPKSDDVNHAIFSDLNNVTVKIQNENIIDGSMRFVIDETNGDLRLYPISIYCIKENERYIFY